MRRANCKGMCEHLPLPVGHRRGHAIEIQAQSAMPKLARVPNPRIEICSSCA
jgi:hypothetical protein